MHIANIIWLPDVMDKLAWKHHVSPEEAVEILLSPDVYSMVPLAKQKLDGTSLSSSYISQRKKLWLSVPETWTQRNEGNMEDAKSPPTFTSYEDMAAFWDSHSLADYWDQTEPATFDISPEVRRRYVVAVDR
jgi:hypothetical protein